MFHIENSNIFEGFNKQNHMLDCMLNNPPPPFNFCCSNSFKHSDSADIMQLAEFGPSLASNEGKSCEEEAATDEEKTSVHANSAIEILDVEGKNKNKNKRKRGKTRKSSEEVERQRMTHILVERNRRKQMNEHLQILRSLMPAYYAHRGDQASIVGAAIEFVRELQQLLQCLESVKRQQAPFILPASLDHQVQVLGYEAGLDQTAESKSCLANIDVRISGLFGLIKIVSRRRRGQLIKIIAAVEHLQLHILQSNITAIQEDVVCSFSVKMSDEAMLTAEDISNSIQQILNSLHANSSMS